MEKSHEDDKLQTSKLINIQNETKPRREICATKPNFKSY